MSSVVSHWLTDWLRLSTKCRKYLLKLSFQPKLPCILTEGRHQMPIKHWEGIIVLIPHCDKNSLKETSLVGWAEFLTLWSCLSLQFPSDFNYKSKANKPISVLIKSQLEVDPVISPLSVLAIVLSPLSCPEPPLRSAQCPVEKRTAIRTEGLQRVLHCNTENHNSSKSKSSISLRGQSWFQWLILAVAVSRDSPPDPATD